MRRRFILVFLAILAMSSLTSEVMAQDEPKLESIRIELWAEFDRPSMLVINEFVVAEGTPLPAKVSVRFPQEGNLIAVAYEKDGILLSTQFESPAEQGAWQIVTINVESRDPYRIEYYQPLDRDGQKRSFTFQWFGDYSVQNFSLSVLLPADSENLITVPPLSDIRLSGDGPFLLGVDEKTNLKMGHAYQFDLEYSRISEALTDPNQANLVSPSEPLASDTPGRIAVDQLPWAIGGLGLGLIGFALWIYWRSSPAGSGNATHSKPSRRNRAAKPSTSEKVTYCHECGTRSIAGDHFCRTCGSKLRVG